MGSLNIVKRRQNRRRTTFSTATAVHVYTVQVDVLKRTNDEINQFENRIDLNSREKKIF